MQPMSADLHFYTNLSGDIKQAVIGLNKVHERYRVHSHDAQQLLR